MHAIHDAWARITGILWIVGLASLITLSQEYDVNWSECTVSRTRTVRVGELLGDFSP